MKQSGSYKLLLLAATMLGVANTWVCQAKDGGSASAQSLKNAYTDCRGSREPSDKVASCSFVLKNSSDKSLLERAHNSRGLGYMALKQYSDAVNDFSSAVAFDRTNPGYVDNRQGAYFPLGDFKRALDDANLAVRLDPSHAYVYKSRGAVLSEIEQYDKAVVDFAQAFKLDQSWTELLVYRAIALRKQSKLDFALLDLDQAVTLKPDLLWAYEERGATYLQIGMVDRAKSDFEFVLRTDPANEKIRERLTKADSGHIEA
jgi:tetratricopeptide (TPR) repeat protein